MVGGRHYKNAKPWDFTHGASLEHIVVYNSAEPWEFTHGASVEHIIQSAKTWLMDSLRDYYSVGIEYVRAYDTMQGGVNGLVWSAILPHSLILFLIPLPLKR